MADFVNYYSPERVVVSFRGYDIAGFMDGTFITAERDEDAFSKHVGVRGDVTRTQNFNRSGKVVLTLMQGAPSNDVLTLFFNQDESQGDLAGPLQIKDLSGTTFISAADAWIVKPAKIERAKEAGGVEWTFECAELIIHVGGHLGAF